MLVCAPTGAGKTNIAMLTFLQLVKQNISDGMLDMGAIKAVYIAPMKALAQEIVAKFSERLKPLKMTVKEFTGKYFLCYTIYYFMYTFDIFLFIFYFYFSVYLFFYSSFFSLIWFYDLFFSP